VKNPVYIGLNVPERPKFKPYPHPFVRATTRRAVEELHSEPGCCELCGQMKGYRLHISWEETSGEAL